ncbi:MAG: hypothetical protein ACPIGG_00085 [Akkermansiaceae bacterium]
MESEPHKPNEDHEHYSIDEMMARLKQSQRDEETQKRIKEGELITRSDGSQVIRVRKRKRRSKQPPKALHPNFKWALIGSAAGLILMVTLITVYIIVKYNGATFKNETESTIAGLVGAKSTELTQLRVTPISASASQADIQWGNMTFYHSAKFENIRADIKATSFLSRNWIGEEIVAELGKIRLQIPSTQSNDRRKRIDLPYRFQSYRCEKLDILFGDPDAACSVTGLHGTLQQLSDSRFQIAFNNGVVEISNWPQLEIASGVITMNGSNTEVDVRLADSDSHKGELLVNGIAYKDKNEPVVMTVKSVNYPMEKLLGQDLGRFIQGNIHSEMGSLTYDHSKENGENLRFVMPFNSNQLMVSEFAMFNDLRDLTRKTQYLHPSFNFCRGTIVHTLDGVSLSNLKLVSSKLLSIEGNIKVNREGALSGKLKVGIPARLFDSESPAPSIFSAAEDGNVYTEVTLGGTIHNPHDDLNARLKSSAPSIIKTSSSPSSPAINEPLIPLDPRKEKEKAFEQLVK